MIAFVTSKDNLQVNKNLVNCLNHMHINKELFDKFYFVFTGGTFDRVVLNKSIWGKDLPPLEPLTYEDLLPNAICLPGFDEGGLILLSYYMAQRKINILAPFFSTTTTHSYTYGTRSMERLSKKIVTTRLRTMATLQSWFKHQADQDSKFNKQNPELLSTLRGSGITINFTYQGNPYRELAINPAPNPHDAPAPAPNIIALLATQSMKDRMIEFVVEYENELASPRFSKILSTNDMGRLIMENAPQIDPNRIIRYHTGDTGGFLEIATEIYFGRCNHVVFLSSQNDLVGPISSDFDNLEGTCDLKNILILEDEHAARRWMESR